ncbi:hypothetical protein ACPOLB_11215 [Rubrivivax sp. RP6-9]|uniref:hypothetical protein n=1 Tax=Rubrivivax sp. RP6-9 TaxID=3415750 RepID=UPI003CC6212D
MSFDNQFDRLWSDVLMPAISGVHVNSTSLHPHRVDLSRKGDSILTEIVQHIAEARLVLADISTLAWIKRDRKKLKAIRNANVMYELGLAHAARLPEEVVVVRGDGDPLDFDISGVRVHRYPSNVGEARRFIGNLLVDAVQSIDQRKTMAVAHALRTLTPHMYLLLHAVEPIVYPNPRTLRDYLGTEEIRAAIKELLAGGMLEPNYEPLPSNFMSLPATDLFKYRPSPFGLAVCQAARSELKFNDAFIPWLQGSEGNEWFAAMQKQGKADPEAK